MPDILNRNPDGDWSFQKNPSILSLSMGCLCWIQEIFVLDKPYIQRTLYRRVESDNEWFEDVDMEDGIPRPLPKPDITLETMDGLSMGFWEKRGKSMPIFVEMHQGLPVFAV